MEGVVRNGVYFYNGLERVFFKRDDNFRKGVSNYFLKHLYRFISNVAI